MASEPFKEYYFYRFVCVKKLQETGLFEDTFSIILGNCWASLQLQNLFVETSLSTCPYVWLLDSQPCFEVPSWGSRIYTEYFFSLKLVYSDYMCEFWATVYAVYVATRIWKNGHWSSNQKQYLGKNKNNNRTILGKGYFWGVFFRGRGA